MSAAATHRRLARRLRHLVPVLLVVLVFFGGWRITLPPTPEAGTGTLTSSSAGTTLRAASQLPAGTATKDEARSAVLSGFSTPSLDEVESLAGGPGGAADEQGGRDALLGTGGPGPGPNEGRPLEGGEGGEDERSSEGDGGDRESSEEEDQQAIEEDEGPPPVLREYEVQPGDTVSGIAARFDIGSEYILWNNVDVIDDADSLQVGAVLQIPGVEGIIHSASVGDSVSALAVKYDSTTEAIVEFEANGFAGDANNLLVGSLILIPGGRRIPPPPADTPAPSGDPWAPSATPWDNLPADPTPSATPWTPPPLETPPPAPSWVWPATGRLTNYFSPQHPLGIDISMVVNTPIAAATAGTVTFVGGNPCCSYGYHVIVEHADGHETLYAHLSQFYVSPGQWVNTGDLLGASGNTGYSTGPHLHFEIRSHGIYEDPLAYLP